jgi:hypothetical protein
MNRIPMFQHLAGRAGGQFYVFDYAFFRHFPASLDLTEFTSQTQIRQQLNSIKTDQRRSGRLAIEMHRL